jgi:hypothetical protein
MIQISFLEGAFSDGQRHVGRHGSRVLRLSALPFALAVFGTSALADFRCFEARRGKTPIQLQFDFPADGGKTGGVSYRKGTGRIEVERVSEALMEEGPDGRPAMVRTIWRENVPNGKGGRYAMETQGAVV